MLFEPRDEMSLRHLFSSSLGESTLNMSYLGPALNVSNNIDTSPDCIILDKREIQWKVLRCEFKYNPQSSEDFKHNGTFDIAIVWQLSGGITKEKLQAELFKQNHCTQVLVLSEQNAFHNLPGWTWKLSQASSNIVELNSVGPKLERIFNIKSVRYSTLVVAYIAVKIYPAAFDHTKMMEKLNKEFQDVHSMAAKGRAVVISKLRQTRPKLIVQVSGNRYKWNVDELNPEGSLVALTRIIKKRDREIPSTEFIDSVRAGVD